MNVPPKLRSLLEAASVKEAYGFQRDLIAQELHQLGDIVITDQWRRLVSFLHPEQPLPTGAAAGFLAALQSYERQADPYPPRQNRTVKSTTAPKATPAASTANISIPAELAAKVSAYCEAELKSDYEKQWALSPVLQQEFSSAKSYGAFRRWENKRQNQFSPENPAANGEQPSTGKARPSSLEAIADRAIREGKVKIAASKVTSKDSNE